MTLNRFNKIFGKRADITEEKVKFINRVKQVLFSTIEPKHEYDRIFERLCFEFGEDTNQYIIKHPYEEPFFPRLTTFTGRDFERTLATICVIYCYYSDNKEEQAFLDSIINPLINKSTTDLEIRWHRGMFYPKGAKKLDQDLIEDPYDLLDKYPSTKKFYKDALDKFAGKKYNDSMGDLYNVLEDLARKVLNNRRTLESNKADFLSKIKLSNQWIKVLSFAIDYFNDNKRHASDGQIKNMVTEEETEATLYLIGIFLRLTLQVLD